MFETATLLTDRILPVKNTVFSWEELPCVLCECVTFLLSMRLSMAVVGVVSLHRLVVWLTGIDMDGNVSPS